MNQIEIVGNLTKDVEIEKTQSGIPRAKFTVAVQRRFANADGKYETDFFNVVAWRGAAEYCAKYMKKGNKIAIAGSMQSRTYEKDGVKHTVWEVIAESVENCTPKSIAGSQGADKPKKATKIDDLPEVEEDDDDLPF